MGMKLEGKSYVIVLNVMQAYFWVLIISSGVSLCHIIAVVIQFSINVMPLYIHSVQNNN